MQSIQHKAKTKDNYNLKLLLTKAVQFKLLLTKAENYLSAIESLKFRNFILRVTFDIFLQHSPSISHLYWIWTSVA